MKSIWKPDDIAFLREHYPTQGSHYCAAHLSLKVRQVTRKASGLGIRVEAAARSHNLAHAASRAKSPHLLNVDPRFFTNPYSPEAAYILGLWWADATFYAPTYKVALELIAKDMNTVEPLFNRAGKWVTHTRTRSGRREQKALITNSKELFQFLMEHGYGNRIEAFPASLLNEIPQCHRPYWLRGYFDGDGWVYYNIEQGMYQAGFAGDYQQNWEFIEAWLMQIGVAYRVTRYATERNGKPHRGSSVIITGWKNVLRVGEYICPRSYILGFPRKTLRFACIYQRFTPAHDDQQASRFSEPSSP